MDTSHHTVPTYAIGYSEPNEEYRDNLYTCCQHLHHLKDWIISAGIVPKEEVHALIDRHVELQVVQDVCIGTKHLTTRFREGDLAITTKMRQALQLTRASQREQEFYYVITYNGLEHEATELIDRSINIWEQYLQSKGILLH